MINTKLAWNSHFFYASELPPLHLSRQASSENWKHQFLRFISESLYCFLCLQSALFYYFRSLIIKLLSTQNSLIFQYCIFWDTNDFVEQHGWLDSTCFFLLLTFLYLGSILHRFLFLLVFIYSIWLLYFFFFILTSTICWYRYISFYSRTIEVAVSTSVFQFNKWLGYINPDSWKRILLKIRPPTLFSQWLTHVHISYLHGLVVMRHLILLWVLDGLSFSRQSAEKNVTVPFLLAKFSGEMNQTNEVTS